jgi:sortase A
MSRNLFSTFILFVLLAGLLAGCSRPTAASTAPTPAPPAPPPQVALGPHTLDKPRLPERLTIPAIQLDVPVVELGWRTQKTGSGDIFSEWDVAEYAAGWHKNSARLDEPGNLVMSGHNNILGAVFRELDQLRRGDEIEVWGDGERLDYVVHDVLIVPEKYATLEQRKENARWIGAFDDHRLTLVSCWPRDDNTHRIIVVAFPTAESSSAVR